MKIVGMMLLVVGISGSALAGYYTAVVPEIDASSAASGLALLSGALLIVRSRRKK